MKQYVIILLMFCSNSFFAQQNKTTIDTVFSENGKIESITYKTNDKKDKVINYYEGNVINEFNFKNGIRDGLTILYNYKKKGRIQSKMMYKDGSLNGIHEVYNDTGKIVSTDYYKNGLRDSVYVRFYITGTKSYIANYKEGKLEGKETTYYKNGKTSMESLHKYGKRDGAVTYYYENGNIQYTGAYRDDKMYGERLCYNENGKPCTGDFKMYSEDGLLTRDCKCINGKPEGELKVYGNGIFAMSVNFKDGKPDGLTYNYTNGKITSTELYKNGVFEKKFKEDDK